MPRSFPAGRVEDRWFGHQAVQPWQVSRRRIERGHGSLPLFRTELKPPAISQRLGGPGERAIGHEL